MDHILSINLVMEKSAEYNKTRRVAFTDDAKYSFVRKCCRDGSNERTANIGGVRVVFLEDIYKQYTAR